MTVDQNLLSFYSIFDEPDALETAQSWMKRRQGRYHRDGIRQKDSEEMALRDAENRYAPDGVLLDEPEEVPMRKLAADDSRRTIQARQKRMEAELKAKSPEPEPAEPAQDWPFRISPKAAAAELEAGDGRESEYEARVEWVGQNLNSPLATPAKAPCNAAWSMLIWASAQTKDFYSIERQVMAKREAEDQEEAALEVDLNKFRELIGRFDCWKRLEARVKSGEIQLEYN